MKGCCKAYKQYYEGLLEGNTSHVDANSSQSLIRGCGIRRLGTSDELDHKASNIGEDEPQCEIVEFDAKNRKGREVEVHHSAKNGVGIGVNNLQTLKWYDREGYKI